MLCSPSTIVLVLFFCRDCCSRRKCPSQCLSPCINCFVTSREAVSYIHAITVIGLFPGAIWLIFSKDMFTSFINLYKKSTPEVLLGFWVTNQLRFIYWYTCNSWDVHWGWWAKIESISNKSLGKRGNRSIINRSHFHNPWTVTTYLNIYFVSVLINFKKVMAVIARSSELNRIFLTQATSSHQYSSKEELHSSFVSSQMQSV